VSGDLKQAVTDATRMRQTHVDWLDHLKPSGVLPGQPHCDHCAHTGAVVFVGDAEHHEECIAAYDNILTCLGAKQPSSTQQSTTGKKWGGQ
jgi:hypothetical protein